MNYKHIVIQAIPLLMETPLVYTQKQLVEKLNMQNIDLKRPMMSHIYKHFKQTQKETAITDVKRVGPKIWRSVAKGFQTILEAEANYRFDSSKNKFVLIGATPITIKNIPLPPPQRIPLFPKGRLRIDEKLEFVQTSTVEMVEVGLRLKTFSTYFTHHPAYIYKNPIRVLLQRGINLKCFVLNPDSDIAKWYEKDRQETGLIEGIQYAIKTLTQVSNEFKQKNYKGTLQLYSYEHFPYNHFAIVDGATPKGKMIISHYINGIPRRECPNFKITRNLHFDLFEKYWQSYQVTLKQAKRIV